METDWVAEVYRFWFEAPEHWFSPDPAFDTQIRQRFGDLYAKLKGEVPAVSNPRESVAAVVVLDQFPRNMFRGTREEFGSDPEALSIARAAVASGADQQIRVDERLFLYMPYMHSENPGDQQRSVGLFASLDVSEALKAAREHHRVIEKFGRFPHRNEVWGRTSTPEEIVYLKTGTIAE